MKKDAANASRQRLYIARLKAAAARVVMLEEENAALKRKLERLGRRSQPGKERE